MKRWTNGGMNKVIVKNVNLWTNNPNKYPNADELSSLPMTVIYSTLPGEFFEHYLVTGILKTQTAIVRSVIK